MPPLEEELQRILNELAELLDKQLDQDQNTNPQPDPFYNVHFLFPKTQLRNSGNRK
jgi:hypothetical protein